MKIKTTSIFDNKINALYKKIMKTTFYIVRHGQTIFNLNGRIQGQSDSPLTKKGQEQARLMAEKIKDIEFILGVSSTSERARDTLLTIANQRFPCRFYKDLKEIGFGTLEGESIEYMKDTSRRDWTEYGGETFDQAAKRVEKRLCTLSENIGNRNILVVSHGAVIREVLHDLEPSFYDIMPNCSMCILVCEDGKLSVQSLPEVLI